MVNDNNSSTKPDPVNQHDAFLRHALHDVENKITAIKGFAQLLQKHGKDIPEKYREDVDTIYDTTDNLDDLMHDFVAIMRTESESLALKPQNILLKDVIIEAITHIEDVEKIKINMSYSFHDDMVYIYADEIALQEVIEQIVSNAIKFSPEGSQVTAETSVSKDGKLQLSIIDTGMGMTLEECAHAGDSFYRVINEETKDIPGTGLGLFLCEILMKKMNGALRIESEKGKGTKVTCVLPLAKE